MKKSTTFRLATSLRKGNSSVALTTFLEQEEWNGVDLLEEMNWLREAVMAEDVSQRKRAAQALFSANQDRESRIKKLELRIRDLEQSSNILAHDLSAPLRMVSSYLVLLDEQCRQSFDAEAQELLRFAIEGATHMKGLVSGLLEYAKTQTPTPSTRPVNSAECLEFVIETLKDAITSSKATVTWDALPTLCVDRALLSAIFSNLISNSLKYGDVSALAIHVSADFEDGYWVFCVRDNGRGISSEHHERIFFLYQRGEDCTDKGGSGIGLAICKRIVTGYGGHIWVESKPGEGSAFYFTFPDL